MASATFRLGYSSTASGTYTFGGYDESITVSGGQYVKAELQSDEDVRSVSYSIVAADEVTWAAGLPTVSTITADKTATFQTATGSTVGHCYTVRCSVNGGRDLNGDIDTASTKQLNVDVLTPQGYYLLSVGESNEHDRTYGHTAKLNDIVRGLDALETPGTYITTFDTAGTCSAGSTVTLYTHECATSSVTMVRAIAAAISTGGGSGAGYVSYATFRRQGAGAATQVSSSTVVMEVEDDASWGFTMSASGAYIKLVGTGSSTAVTKWTVQGDLTSVSYT